MAQPSPKASELIDAALNEACDYADSYFAGMPYPHGAALRKYVARLEAELHSGILNATAAELNGADPPRRAAPPS